MSNKYLVKIAKFKLPSFRGSKERDILDAAGFAMSGTGLAVGLNNYNNNKRTSDAAVQKADLEAKSLKALNDISRTLKSKENV